MSSKRQRVNVELAASGQAALPSVCYLPSLPEGTGHATEPSSASNHQEPSAKRLKFSVHSKPRLGSTVQLVQASAGDIDYVGRSDGDENKGSQPCCFALGVYRPGDGKLKLVNVAGDRLFRLDARLPGLVYDPTGAGVPTDADEREIRKAAARRLVDEFGSTRRRRQMTAREAGMVTADRINSGEAVQQLLDSIAAKGQEQGMTRDEVTRRAFAQRTIPPHNPAATSPADAYPLELLLGRPAAEGQGTGAGGGDAGGIQADDGTLAGELNVGQIHKLIEDDQELAKAREKELVPAYVISRLGPLRNLKANAADDPAARKRSRERARYLALLVVLLRIHSRSNLRPKTEGLSGVAKELRVREGLAEFLLERFFIKSEHTLYGLRYERPAAQSQLLLSYILAVAMVVEEGFMDKEQFEELRAALKMDAAKVAAALQQLGCTTKSAKLRVDKGGDQAVEVASYTASLLKQSGKGPGLKTLEQCFPALRLPKAKSKGR